MPEKNNMPSCKVCNDIGLVIDQKITKIPTGERDEKKKPVYRDETTQATRQCPKGCPINEKKGQEIKRIISSIKKK